MKEDKGTLDFVKSIPTVFMLHFWFVMILFFPLIYVYGTQQFQIFCTILLIYQYSPIKNKTRNRYYRKVVEYFRAQKYFKEYDYAIEDPYLNEYQKKNQDNALNIINYDSDQQIRQHLFCMHPHGIFCYGGGIATLDPSNKVTYQLPGVASRMTTLVPFSGLIHMLHGNFGANNKQFIELMKQKISFMLYPGGFEEASLTKYNEQRVFIKNRKGFIKYAIQNRYKIHPCYQFGESSLYYTIQNDRIGKILAKMKMINVFAYSKFLLFPLRSARLFLVIGKEVDYEEVKDKANPTKEEIDIVHQKYIDELSRCYDKYKDQYADGKQLDIC